VKFPESQLAHRILDPLDGIEIGGSAHNDFNLPSCRNVDFTADHTLFSDEQVRLCGEVMPVDIVADAAALPLPDASVDYVLSSHQLEHVWDVIGTIEEWLRVLKPPATHRYPWCGDPVPEMGGFLYLVLPHPERMIDDRTSDADEPHTTISELWDRHYGRKPPPDDYVAGNRYAHRSFWTSEIFLEDMVPYLCSAYDLRLYAFETHDCRVGNGFTVVLQKRG